MPIGVYLIIAIVISTVFYFVGPPAVRTFLRYRGKRLVSCPEAPRPAAVNIDVMHAVLSAVTGSPELRLKGCSQWPEHQDCGQACLLQIQVLQDDCKVHNILTRWYEDKECIFCAKPFLGLHFPGPKPALLIPDGRIVGWQELRAEDLRTALETARPVCQDCHRSFLDVQT